MSRPRTARVVQQIVAAIAILLGFATPVRAQTFIVDDEEDRIDWVHGDGFCRTNLYSCTLRAAIQEANALPGQQTIALGAGEHLTQIDGADEDAAATGDLDVTDDLVIEGSGATTTTVQASTADRIFDVAEGVNLTLSDVTVFGGLTFDVGAGLRAREGAFVFLARTVFDRNQAVDAGGGVALVADTPGGATLLAYESRFVQNIAGVPASEVPGVGGAIHASGRSSVYLLDSWLDRNIADHAPALYSDFGPVTIERSTITGHESEDATLWLSNVQPVRIENSTIANNRSQLAILFFTSDGETAIQNATITGNAAQFTILDYYDTYGTVELRNSVLFNSATERECGGVASLGHNAHPPGDAGACLFGSATDIIVIDPLLGSLADNGGHTLTRMPLPGSPLRDAGDDAGCPALDQRATDRPQDGDGDGVAHCDIGAVEAPEPRGLALPAAFAALALQVMRRRSL